MHVCNTMGVKRTYPQGNMIEDFVSAMQRCTDDLAGHSFKVANLAVEIGKSMSLGDEQLAHIQVAGILHDVGKVHLDSAILGKPGPLDSRERRHVELHPRFGFAMTRGGFPAPVADAVYSHHEWFDGSGYPRGLSGNGIPLLARVLLVADAFDAMTSHRCYRAAISAEAARSELLRMAGPQFDPGVVEVFLTLPLPSSASVA